MAVRQSALEVEKAISLYKKIEYLGGDARLKLIWNSHLFAVAEKLNTVL